MLSRALFFSDVSIPPPNGFPTLTSTDAVRTVLGSPGYRLELTEPSESGGSLSHDGASVTASLAWSPGDPAQGIPAGYPFLVLNLDLAVPKPMKVSPPLKDRFGLGQIAFLAHLGGTVTETAQIDLRKGATRTSIRRALDAFWTQGQAFAKAQGTPYVAARPFDPAKTTLEDSLVLDVADDVSFRRAVATWGWSEPEHAGYASQGWIVPIRISDRTLYLRQTVVGLSGLPQSVEIARYDDRPAKRVSWDAQGSSNVPTVIYLPDGMYPATTVETLDLTKGVTLGELRRRIAAFAARS